MSSPSFRFRQFEVFHDRCAMKVGTDGVLLGAWAGQTLSPTDKAFPVLDIGTGSGLVALMLAQRFPQARITALDIEPSAVEQAQYNFAHSPWPERLTAVQSSLQSFRQTTDSTNPAPDSPALFRLIVSNPPYFQNSLKNPDKLRELARHTDSLSYSDLVSHTARLLAPGGVGAYILPAEAEPEILSLLQTHSLSPLRILEVHSKPSKQSHPSQSSQSSHPCNPSQFSHSCNPSQPSRPSKPAKRILLEFTNFSAAESASIYSIKCPNSRTTPEPTPAKSLTTPEPTRSIFYIESESSPRSDEYAALTRDFYL